MEETREFVWLKRYEEVSSSDPGIEAGKPWTRIQAVVSARLAGIELEDERVQLGESVVQPFFVAAREGEAFNEASSGCRIIDSGVLCRGHGIAVLQLDFCRPEVKTCLRQRVPV